MLIELKKKKKKDLASPLPAFEIFTLAPFV